MAQTQLALFDDGRTEQHTSTFVKNMSLPVHRWFRYSAGFSAAWADSLISEFAREHPDVCVFDPFAGSGTTLLAAEDVGVPCYGTESHPFIARVARAKLMRQSNPDEYKEFADRVWRSARQRKRSVHEYPDLIQRCFSRDHLDALDCLRCAFEVNADGSAASELTWLTLVSILRSTSHAGTAQWQYVLPNKTKKQVVHPTDAFRQFSRTVYRDMELSQNTPRVATLLETDARICAGVPDGSVNLVVTSPPYPNNYDYADATRLEMMFMREIEGWADLQGAVRRHLIRSCSQHTTKSSVDLDEALSDEALKPIEVDLRAVCNELARVRLTKGGKKNYHLMVASYFRDLAHVWGALRRVCADDGSVCFVIGDSAPYGVYVPVADWLGRLAVGAGFERWSFEKIRDRNIKWKNRKHRVPLCEGRLWVRGRSR